MKRIDHYTTDITETRFLQDSLIQDAVIRNIEIIGEASHNIERHHPEFVAAHPHLALQSAYQMRNAVAHGYFKIDMEIVWKTVQEDFPDFYAQIATAAETVHPRDAE
ncbi:MAG: DUF86 domain-containing protein [Moraxellaceae bacterium]|nr:DUF86 domain-containing protein [Moraxellaceae bacterium]